MIAAIFEIAKARSYFLRTMYTIAALSTASVAIKLALLIAQELPKTRDILDKQLRESIGKECVTGFWNRAFFIWLNPTFMFGFRNVLAVDDLSALGPRFSSKYLSQRLNRNWKKGKLITRADSDTANGHFESEHGASERLLEGLLHNLLCRVSFRRTSSIMLCRLHPSATIVLTASCSLCRRFWHSQLCEKWLDYGWRPHLSWCHGKTMECI